ncbi:MAG: glycosyl hydrolase 53 family protein, partial [Bacteroidota bacterium]|nr:glycosyl hydrolase 53 family protein [Bacteroidota bacterium]
MLRQSDTGITKFLLAIFMIGAVSAANAQNRFRKPAPAGTPNEIQVTPYKTTMLANGKDEVLITVKLIDSKGDTLPTAKRLIEFHIKGDARIIRVNHAEGFATLPHTDSTSQVNIQGICEVILRAGRTRGNILFKVTADSLWAGSTEIHTVQPGIAHAVTTEKYIPKRVNEKVLGADISFLPQLESRGMKFSDKGTPGDAIQIMKAHGFNYIRLRIFNEPANPKGYSPKQGFCDLEHTKQMAKRIKAAGMKFLLDFHYSDYWADPQQQNKPAAWAGQDFTTLKKSLYAYTVNVMRQLKAQGTSPDM